MKILVYIECASIDDLDEALGAGVENWTIEKYAAVTIDGAPVHYDELQDSAASYLNEMGLKCMGVTE